jgi:hypothetical protein
MERGRGTASLDDGMVENAIAVRLRERRVGYLVHAVSLDPTRVFRARDQRLNPPPSSVDDATVNQ